jgi:hypothetical protein
MESVACLTHVPTSICAWRDLAEPSAPSIATLQAKLLAFRIVTLASSGGACSCVSPKRSLRPCQTRHNVPVEAHEPMQLALEQAFLVAVRTEAFRSVFDIRGRPDPEAEPVKGSIRVSCSLHVGSTVCQPPPGATPVSRHTARRCNYSVFRIYFECMGRLDRRLDDMDLMMVRRRRGKPTHACARACATRARTSRSSSNVGSWSVRWRTIVPVPSRSRLGSRRVAPRRKKRFTQRG